MNNKNLPLTKHQTVRTTRAWTSFLTQMNFCQLIKYFLPISYILFFLGFFFLPSSKSQSKFFYVGIAFPFFISIFMKKIDFRSLFSSRIFLLSTIFLVYMFSTLLWAENCELSEIFKDGRRGLYILIFLGVTIHLIQLYPNFLQRLLVLLCWTAVIFAVGYIVFYYSQYSFPYSRLKGFGQLDNPILASSVYGIALIASMYLFQQQQTVKMKLLYLGMSLVLFLYILLAQSRGPLLALAVTIVGWLMLEGFSYKKGKHRHHNDFFLLLLIISAAAMILLTLYPDFLESRLVRGASYRLEIWGQSLLQSGDAPFFGHGLNADTRLIMSDGSKMRHHHSVYMTTLFYGGAIGLLLLVVLVGSALWHGFTHVEKQQRFLLTCMLLFGAICIASAGSTLISYPKPFWIFFWFPVSLVAASELRGKFPGGE